MKHRVGVKRIARQAGVSVATVDRVLNQRSGVSVRPATVKKVLDAVALLNAENISRLAGEQGSRNFSFAMVVQSGAGFNTRLRQSLRSFRTENELRESVEIQEHFTTDLGAEAFARLILDNYQKTDGMILACQEMPVIRDAVDHLAAEGYPIVCITTDLPNTERLAYVAMDQYRAGRVAGTLIGRFTCGRAGEVLFVVSGSYRCQQEREIGFRQVLRESFPRLSVSESLRSGDADEFAYQRASEYFRAGQPTPLAIYNVSGGNQGILQALAEHLRPDEPAPVYVCHDLTPNTRRSLIEGRIDAVIDYETGDAIARAVMHLINHHQPDSHRPDPAPLGIRICLADTV